MDWIPTLLALVPPAFFGLVFEWYCHNEPDKDMRGNELGILVLIEFLLLVALVLNALTWGFAVEIFGSRELGAIVYVIGTFAVMFLLFAGVNAYRTLPPEEHIQDEKGPH